MTAPRRRRAARRRRWSPRPAGTARSARRRRTPAPPGTRAPRPPLGGMRPRTTRHPGPRQARGRSRQPTARGRADHRARVRAGRAPLLPLRPRTPPPANRVRAAPSPRRSRPRSPPPPARPPRRAAGPPRPPLVLGGIRRRAPRTQARRPPPAHRRRRRGRASWEVAPPWFHTSRSVAAAAATAGLLPYGPKTTSGCDAVEADIAWAGLGWASWTSSFTPRQPAGSRAACRAHTSRAVDPARPKRASGPVSGVTSATRKMAMAPRGVSPYWNLTSKTWTWPPLTVAGRVMLVTVLPVVRGALRANT